MDRIVFHIDVNAAYLSWEAARRLSEGSKLDIRKLPSAIAGNPEKRRGIILAKSYEAKKYGIKTGETLYEATNKCPNLLTLPPDYNLYMKSSNKMVELLSDYTDQIERYSIDEVFLDATDAYTRHTNPIDLADEIRERIKDELGFSVCVGISHNKLLAKMATDLRKPDFTNTLFEGELDKIWKLPVSDLFMVGKKTSVKLNRLGIYTIGELSKTNPEILKNKLKSHGLLIWQYANGIDDSPIRPERPMVKGMSNSTTIPFDVEDLETANMILLALCENVTKRLRDQDYYGQVLSVGVKYCDFSRASSQKKLYFATNSTNLIYREARLLLEKLWDNIPIRQISVRVSDISSKDRYQMTFYDYQDKDFDNNLDRAIDFIRDKYGNRSISRACFIDSGIDPMIGGVGDEDDFLMMNSHL